MQPCPHMQRVIGAIAAKHALNLDDVGARLCLEMEGYDRLSIEVLDVNRISVSHTYAVAGRRIPDPDIEFVTSANHTWIPIAITQALGGLRIYAELAEDGSRFVRIHSRGQAELAQFAELWARNILDQGWLERSVKNEAASGRLLTLPEDRTPRFSLGQVVATPGALEALERAGETADVYLGRHVTTDWGDLDEQDRQANAQALLYGGRLFSAYTLKDGTRLWLITEADRSVSTLLLPSEY